MHRCGACMNCVRPSLKKGCLVLKEAREADRASRYAPVRRHTVSVVAVPLAKLTQQPGTTPAAATPEQPGSLPSSDPIVLDCPSVDPHTEQGDHSWPENNKRAASEDSETQGLHKRLRFADSTDPQQMPHSGMASRDTADPCQCLLQVPHSPTSWLVVPPCNCQVQLSLCRTVLQMTRQSTASPVR